MEYSLMRKDELIALFDFDDRGNLLAVSKNLKNPELAPLAYRRDADGLKKWWEERSIPLTRKDLQRTLQGNGLSTHKEYLFKNLGLSLTDYYWIKPFESGLKWKDVNLFDNDFKENILYSYKQSSIEKKSLQLSPNSSLKGELEKSWIIKGGKRMLLKGNFGYSSEESINEIIATLLHQKQGWDNFTEYKLAKIKDRKYSFGCMCETFTSQDAEFVSAWDIITSKNNDEGLSDYEFFVKLCVEMGLNEKQLRKDLEYQIMTDYVISNRDRHLNNIGILRDANSLKPIRLAPIYDSGKSMFVGRDIPTFDSDIIDNETNSFCPSESKLLQLVQNKSWVCESKLPTESEIEKLYRKDEKMSETRLAQLLYAYRIKRAYFKKWQEL